MSQKNRSKLSKKIVATKNFSRKTKLNTYNHSKNTSKKYAKSLNQKNMISIINSKLEKLHKFKFNFNKYYYESINHGLSGGKSGAILFNIIDKKTGKINKNYIGKTLVLGSLFRNSNISYLYDKINTNKDSSFIENYIDYIKTNKTSYIAKIYSIGYIELHSKTYLSMIIENLGNYSKMVHSKSKKYSNIENSFDFKITDKPFNDSNNNNLRNNLEDGVEKLDIKLDLDIINRDLDFLSENNRIDYSSILFIKGNRYRYGIIDVLQPYNTKKKIENVFKDIFEIRSSIIKPSVYKIKFLNLLKEFNLIN